MLALLAVKTKPGSWILLLLVIGLLLLAALFLLLNKQKQIMDFLVSEHKKEREQKVKWEQSDQDQLYMLRKRVEYTALQSQINPHFLYNTLESIRSRALLDDNTEIASMTEILSKFFRYCISNGERLIKIREEINHIRNYYYIQKYRFEERMNMDIEIESDELNDLYIPKMSLQPLVENAMIHGLEKIAGDGKIIMRVMNTKKKVLIMIEDNGAGMNPEQLERLNDRLQSQFVNASSQKGSHNGIALSNVNARIKLGFGPEYGIHYRSIEGRGTQAILTLPRIDEFARVKYSDILHIEES